MPTTWDNQNGMFTLAGDATHSMPPHKFVLNRNRVLRLTCSLAEMRERASKEVHISKEQATKVLDWRTLMDTPMVRMGMKKQADAVAAA